MLDSLSKHFIPHFDKGNCSFTPENKVSFLKQYNDAKGKKKMALPVNGWWGRLRERGYKRIHGK